MVSVKARVAMIEQGRAGAMSNRLKMFLDFVWTNRAAILATGAGSGGKIYGMYSGQASPANPTEQSVLSFLNQLQPLENHPAGRPCWIQQDDPNQTIAGAISDIEAFSFMAVLEAAGKRLPEGWQRAAGEPPYSEQLDDLLYFYGNTFYHLPRQSSCGSNARIYLNVRPAFSIRVMTFVVNEIVGRFPNAGKAKLAGPCNRRRDAIVMWVASLTQIDNILDAIATYQRRHRAFFEPGVPRLCKEAIVGGQLLKGVGLASEPPPDEFGRSVSYGKSRTTPIFETLSYVLDHTPNAATLKGAAAQQAKEKFIAAVLAELRSRGIDPGQVHI